MVKKRDYYKIVILEPAKTRLKNNQCPSCGKPQSEWTRRKDWRCCSVKCTKKWRKLYLYYGWKEIRDEALKRDKYTCKQCGVIPERKDYHHDNKDYIKYATKSWNFLRMEGEYLIVIDDRELVGDHIVPIALGGNEWDLKNIQTLCIDCNKIKTKEDAKKIAELRKSEKMGAVGQITLPSAISPTS